VAQLKAYGQYSFSISDPLLFLNQMVGNGAHFTLDEMRSYILSAVTDAVGDLLSRQGRQISDLIYLTGDVAPSIAARVQEKMGSRGINLDQFTVEAINAENI
jgi:membrane protease subunit (stomatin/prohibitin family)